MLNLHLSGDSEADGGCGSLGAKSCPTHATPWTEEPGRLQGILQARILEWVAISFSRGPSQPRNQTQVSCIVGRFFTNWATREAPLKLSRRLIGRFSLKDSDHRDRMPCGSKCVPIFKLDHLSFCCWVVDILYIFWILDPFRYMICKNSSPYFVGCLLIFLIVPFNAQSFKFWWGSVYSFFFHYLCLSC